MLKASQEFFSKRKEDQNQKKTVQHKPSDNHSIQSQSDYTSVASSSIVTQAELARDL